jgi:hypothetical protein
LHIFQEPRKVCFGVMGGNCLHAGIMGLSLD